MDDEWVLLCVSGDIRLPCPLCLQSAKGLPTEDWKSATMERAQLQTHLVSRFRQHLARHHDLLARDPTAESMRLRAKELLCSLLHEQPVSDSPSSPSAYEVHCFIVY